MTKPAGPMVSKRIASDGYDSDTLDYKRSRYSVESRISDRSNCTPGPSQLPPVNGLSSASRRERLGKDREKPAELFRKDLISAMKMADTEPLCSDDYILISDPWRMEWEKGVQVPVQTATASRSECVVREEQAGWHGSYGFRLPQRKLLHAAADARYRQGMHALHETHALADQVCRYDLDDVDVAWLDGYNDVCDSIGCAVLEEWVMERVIEEMERQCHANMQIMIKTVEGLGIEYDENVVCDVCRSPDSEDGNEMVFCDACDICVHQACYGIQKVPVGSWLCRLCALGIKPECILCPIDGGAMKSTRSGSKWAHVSCALWIPEVSIGCPEKMEPITKVSHIPASRWLLVCALCRERTGACIQCCVKTCKTAFHVTCAFKGGLDMMTILDNHNDDVQLKAYCEKHSRRGDTPKKGDAAAAAAVMKADTPKKGESPARAGVEATRKEREMTEDEKKELRSHRLQKLEDEFYVCVRVDDVADAVQTDHAVVDFIYNYWLLKRRANFNRPLLTPLMEEADLLSRQQEDSLYARMRMFIHLRQDLERVRNLCYMVNKREKMKRQIGRLKESVFRRQVALVSRGVGGSSVRRAHRMSAGLYDQHARVLALAARQAACMSAAEEPSPAERSAPRHYSDCLAAVSPRVKAGVARPSPAGSSPDRSSPDLSSPAHCGPAKASAARTSPVAASSVRSRSRSRSRSSPAGSSSPRSGPVHRKSSPARSSPARSSPARSSPGRSRPGRSSPGRSSPGRSSPGRSSPARSSPGRSSPGRSCPGRSSQGRSGLTRSSPARSIPGRSSPASSKPERSSPTMSKPRRSRPERSRPAHRKSSPSRSSPTRLTAKHRQSSGRRDRRSGCHRRHHSHPAARPHAASSAKLPADSTVTEKPAFQRNLFTDCLRDMATDAPPDDDSGQQADGGRSPPPAAQTGRRSRLSEIWSGVTKSFYSS